MSGDIRNLHQQRPATDEELDRDFETLHVVSLGDNRYAMPFEGYPPLTGWFVFTRQAARTAQISAYADGQEDFSPGLSPQLITTMPAWWSPEQRFAWRVPRGDACECALGARLDIVTTDPHNIDAQRITADLATGEEVVL